MPVPIETCIHEAMVNDADNTSKQTIASELMKENKSKQADHPTCQSQKTQGSAHGEGKRFANTKAMS